MLYFRIALLLPFLLSGTLFAQEASAEHVSNGKWLTDMNVAQTAAKESKLPLLLCFLGSDWDESSMRLEREVFAKKEFTSFASGRLILMKVDFPAKKKLPEPELELREKLKKQFKVSKYPVLFLLDPGGAILHRFGYHPGGPEPYLARLTAKLKEYREASADEKDPVEPDYSKLSEEDALKQKYLFLVKQQGVLKRRQRAYERALDELERTRSKSSSREERYSAWFYRCSCHKADHHPMEEFKDRSRKCRIDFVAKYTAQEYYAKRSELNGKIRACILAIEEEDAAIRKQFQKCAAFLRTKKKKEEEKNNPKPKMLPKKPPRPSVPVRKDPENDFIWQ